MTVNPGVGASFWFHLNNCAVTWPKMAFTCSFGTRTVEYVRVFTQSQIEADPEFSLEFRHKYADSLATSTRLAVQTRRRRAEMSISNGAFLEAEKKSNRIIDGTVHGC